MEIMVKERLTYKYLVNFYQGKHVFVTGHTGFKGTWLIKILYDLGAIVRGYALVPNTNPSLYTDVNGDSLCDSIIGDINNLESLKSAILEFKPDYIFHLAAQPLVNLSYEIPIYTFQTNTIGTANLLEAVRFLDKKCSIVLITTDKVYLNKETNYYYKETDSLGGYDPYSASKACCEFIIDSFRNSFFNHKNYNSHHKALAVARAGNVIGGGDWSKNRLLPDIVKSLYKNEEIVIRNPNSIRPWQHVIEPLMGYLDLGIKLAINPIHFGQAFNFGPNFSDNLCVEEVVINSMQFWEKGSYRIDNSIDYPHEARVLMLDINKTLKYLDWRPFFNSKVAIERTINWYKLYYSGFSAVELMQSDIKFYHNISAT
jgi:CDP-glucose 4,6-dehydratase